REWRFHDVELTPFLGADGQLDLSFALTSDGGLELGGWTIDQLCIVGHDAAPPPPPPPPSGGGLCGDGFLDQYEQCDDGNLQNGDGCSSGCLLEEDEASDTDEPIDEA